LVAAPRVFPTVIVEGVLILEDIVEVKGDPLLGIGILDLLIEEV